MASEQHDQVQMDERQIIQDFARSQITMLASKIVSSLERLDATLYASGEEVLLASLWEEFCYCTQYVAANPRGEQLLYEHVEEMVRYEVEKVKEVDARVIWLAYGQIDFPYSEQFVEREEIFDDVLDRVKSLSLDHDLRDKLPEWMK